MFPSFDPLAGAFALSRAAAGFVPIPFLDKLVERTVTRKMVDVIAKANHVALSDDAVAKLSVERAPTRGSTAATWAKTLALAPFRVAFVGIFAALKANSATARIGKDYARGLGLRVAFEDGLVQSFGPTSVATALDETVEAVETRPLRRGLGILLQRLEHASSPRVSAAARWLERRTTKRIEPIDTPLPTNLRSEVEVVLHERLRVPANVP